MSMTKDELKDLIRSVVKETMPQSSAPTETAVDHACSCPDCYCNIMDKMNKESDYFCANCGLPLGNEKFVRQIEKCPNCGRSDTKRKK